MHTLKNNISPHWGLASINWPIIIGLLFLYTPVYYSLINGIWQSDEFSFGSLVLAIILYLFWDKRNEFKIAVRAKSSTTLGLVLLVFGLLMYIVGRALNIITFDILCQAFVISGLILYFCGVNTLKKVWFPIFFILFMIPMPPFIIDTITVPMKSAVSYMTELILYNFGYPIARSGVILQIGQYQLLVADACAGMHTLISLEALGLLYLNLVRHTSVLRNALLAVLIIPISFTANVIRVITLSLVTYYYGNEAGQGFIHGFAGMLLFIVALTLIMFVDTLIQRFIKQKSNV